MRRRLALLAVPAIALLLTACGPSEPASTATSKPTDGSTPTASASETPEASATPTASATPIAFGCDTVLSAQQVYDFNPNYGVDPGFSPTAGTPIADAAAMSGLACGWLNQTSGDVVEVAVARPSADELTRRTDAAAASSSAASGFDGYFGVTGGYGIAQSFPRGYWVVVRSNAFLESGDAAQLVSTVTGNLP